MIPNRRREEELSSDSKTTENNKDCFGSPFILFILQSFY